MQFRKIQKNSVEGREQSQHLLGSQLECQVLSDIITLKLRTTIKHRNDTGDFFYSANTFKRKSFIKPINKIRRPP